MVKRYSPAVCRRLFAISAVVFAMISAVPSEARSVVVRSTGPSAAQHRPGEILREPIVLRLLAGDRITILDEQGTRELRGPATIDETAAQSSRPAPRLSWQGVLGDRLRPRAAGTRSVDVLPPEVPVATPQKDLWLIDPLFSGHWCLKDAQTVGFWREETAGGQAMTMTSRGKTAAVAWLDGSQSAAWPVALAPQQGATYSLKLAGGPARSVTVHMLSDAVKLEGLANQLADNKCYHQLGMLVGP